MLPVQAVLRWLAPLCLAAALQDPEIVSEFRRYFRRYADTATRVEAVLALEGAESPEVVRALVPVLEKAEPEVVEACVRVLKGFETRAPAEELLGVLAAERGEPVRLALLQAAAEARYEGTADVAIDLCEDPAWPVRRAAVLALCATGDPRAAGLVPALAADGEPAVRCAVLEGLAALGAPSALEPAQAMLVDPVWQVRASAIAALGRVRDKRSVPLLIERLEAEEGRLKSDAAGALASLTGRAFGQRAELWRSFWEANAERYVLPTDEELAALRRRQAERQEEYSAGGDVRYHGIDTPSRRIVFVINVSGSMEQSVMEKERFEGGGYPSFLRIDIVKTELARTIERLEAGVRFNIFAFATDVRAWKKDLVAANVLNKSAAASWIERLEAIGGESGRDLAEVGLVAAANLEGGRTNSYGALMRGLGIDPELRGGPGYQVEADTLFFLSDGRPSHGAYTVPEDILREVRAANELRKVVIHAIAIGDVQVEFMRALAEQNGGEFVDLGR